jgi:antitoxin CptB
MSAASDEPNRPGAGLPLWRGRMVGEGDGEALRKRRLKFRVWHRGMREVDLILGRFADAHLDGLGAGDLDAFEALLEVPDQELYAWVIGQEPIPAADDTPLLRRLIAFNRGEP